MCLWEGTRSSILCNHNDACHLRDVCPSTSIFMGGGRCKEIGPLNSCAINIHHADNASIYSAIQKLKLRLQSPVVSMTLEDKWNFSIKFNLLQIHFNNSNDKSRCCFISEWERPIIPLNYLNIRGFNFTKSCVLPHYRQILKMN